MSMDKSDDELAATVVVSPARLGGEEKNQDRARWFPASRVACVCDGVSTSPHSDVAAESVSQLSPVLFGRDVNRALGFMAETLFAFRREAQQAGIKRMKGRSAAMQAALEDAAREKLKKAYQTTLVAASFVSTDDHMSVEVVTCGDAGFFGYSAGGELLTCSLFSTEAAQEEGHRCQAPAGFQPGAQILVKVLGCLSDWPGIAERSQIRRQHYANWFVCLPLDRCDDLPSRGQKLSGKPPSCRHTHELLLVPSYLLGKGASSQKRRYHELRYSKVIRCVCESRPSRDFSTKTSVTAVLPDHFQTGKWAHHQERLPLDGHVVLASDGFYESFDQPGDIWTWLIENARRLEGQSHHEVLDAGTPCTASCSPRRR